MYYNAGSPQVLSKPAQQHDPWSQPLQPGPTNPQPPSPAYPVYPHHSHQLSNGILVSQIQPPAQGHNHSLSLQSAFSQQDPSLAIRPPSPNGNVVPQSPHWQHQMMKAEVRAL